MEPHAQSATPETSRDTVEGEPHHDDGIKGQAQRIAEHQKTATAERIGGLAHATDSAADELATEIPQAAEALHGMAARLQDAATALREHNVDELLRGTGDFARNQPVTFFAGAVLAGFALSRFLKSTPRGGQR